MATCDHFSLGGNAEYITLAIILQFYVQGTSRKGGEVPARFLIANTITELRPLELLKIIL
jgi:hypothetical protein